MKNPLLKRHKYTVLKNEANRTEKQQIAFKAIEQANLNIAKAWHIKENFKSLFSIENKTDIEELFDQWMTNSKEVKISYINNVALVKSKWVGSH